MYSSRQVLALKEVFSLVLRRGVRDERSRIRRSLKAQKERNEHLQVAAKEFEARVKPRPPSEKQMVKSLVEPYLSGAFSSSEPLTVENQHDHLASALTSLHPLPYPEQLKVKWNINKRILKEFETKLTERKTPWGFKEKFRFHPETIPSPVTEAYRNKDEFRVHVGVDSNPKTVGFFVGRFEDQSLRCINADHLLITRKEHKTVAKHFENFIRQSPLPACDMFNNYSGYWRGITVRSNSRGDIMAVVVMHPQQLTKEEIEEQKSEVASYFQSLDDCKITSMYFQASRYKRPSSAEAPYEHLFGDWYIYEELSGLKFRISPGSFFQVNTSAAEGLYTTIKGLCNVNQDSVVLDVCSGTGAISLMLAPHVFSTVGVETNQEAVEDAKVNAELNGIKNAVFLQGEVEALIPNLVNALKSRDATVIMNPTRSGVANRVIRNLRAWEELKRIIYVSCNPAGAALHNFVALCKPATANLPGQRFEPKFAVSMDLFPHTNLSELVVVFER